MGADQFRILPVSQVDDAQLLEFAISTWGEEGWRRVQKPWWRDGNYALANAAIDSTTNRIAGLCVAVPSEWRLPESRDVQAVSICGWYVAPPFMGKGLGKTLVRSFNHRASCMNALSISDAAVGNFTKLGWAGPYASWLRLLPFPIARRAVTHVAAFSVHSHLLGGGAIPSAAAAALDAIDAGRPPTILRRKRRAVEWSALLRACPTRRLEFHFLYEGTRPIGYFVIRPTDKEAGLAYRVARLHYVSDVVLNCVRPEVVEFLVDSMAVAAPLSAGALLLCTTSRAIAEATSAQGWMDQRTKLLGPRLLKKAPRFMLGGDFAPMRTDDFWLTFSDSDVDLNI